MKMILTAFVLVFGFNAFAEETNQVAANPAASIETTDVVDTTVTATTDTTQKKTGVADVAADKTKPAKDNVAESEIALNLEAQKTAKAEESPIVKMLLSISVIGVLGTAAYMYFKKNGYKNTKLKAGQIKVLTQFHLGPKKNLAIIRVAGESILIGVTDHNISLIKTLSMLDEELPEPTSANFDSLLEKDSNNSRTSFAMPMAKAADDEDFAMSGIKNIVNQKIKNMRSI